MSVLKGMYAAETEYLAAGGPGSASFAPYFATDVGLTRVRVRARARATGRELRFPILQTITVEDGRITEVHPFYWDTAAIAKACSTQPPTTGSAVSHN
jgi:hypothetical protein